MVIKVSGESWGRLVPVAKMSVGVVRMAMAEVEIDLRQRDVLTVRCE